MKKIQTLNEELIKMRKLMSFNINENSHDTLSEENIEKSVKGTSTDPEEEECDRVYGGPPEVAFQMTEELNVLLTNSLNEVLRQTKVNIVATNPDNIYIGIGDIQLPLTKDPRSKGLYAFKETKIKIPFATELPLSLFKDELLKDKCFKLLYDRYDTIKNQIEGEKINMVLIPSGHNTGSLGVKMFIVEKNKKLKKQFKKGTAKFINFENANLLDFSKAFYIKLNKDLYGLIEADWGVELTRIVINGAELPKEWGTPDPISNKCYCNDIETGEQIEYLCDGELPERCKGDNDPIVFDFVVEANKNFEFDKADLTEEAKGIIDKNIVDEWDSIPQNRKDGYLNFLKDKTINVNAYASIDALSNFKVSGGYLPCKKSGQLRKDYNKCLSQARAEAVVEYLKTIADGAFKDINFVSNGMGETNQFSGLKWDNEKQPKTNSSGLQIDEKSPYSTDETKADRRFEVKFPKWHTED